MVVPFFDSLIFWFLKYFWKRSTEKTVCWISYLLLAKTKKHKRSKRVIRVWTFHSMKNRILLSPKFKFMWNQVFVEFFMFHTVTDFIEIIQKFTNSLWRPLFFWIQHCSHWQSCSLNQKVKLITSFSVFVGYRHFWTDHYLRWVWDLKKVKLL